MLSILFLETNSILLTFGEVQMMKKWMLGIALLPVSGFSQAGLVYNNLVTGADMAGIEVTATLTGGLTETFLWSADPEVLGSTGNAIIDHEGFSGGVSSGTGWSLSQQGYTLGNSDAGTPYGVWSFTDTSGTVESITINTGDTGIVFDTVTIDSLAEDTNGSGQGRGVFAFTDFANDVIFTDLTASYSDNVVQELYKTLTLDLDVAGTEFSFWADTDLQQEDDGSSEVVLVVDEVVEIANEEVLNQTIADAAADSTALSGDIVPGGDVQDAQAAVDAAATAGNKVAIAIQKNEDIIAAIADDPTLLEDATAIDITDLPEVSDDPVEEARNQQLIEIVEEILEQDVKEEWIVEGNGDIDVEIDRETGDVAIALTVENQDDVNAPLVFKTLIDTPFDSFYLNFNLMFETITGSLDLSLNGLLLDTFDAIDFEELTNVNYLVDNADFFGLLGAELKYSLFPGSPSSAQLSNISVSFLQDNTEVPEPSTLFTFALGLVALTSLRKKSSGK